MSFEENDWIIECDINERTIIKNPPACSQSESHFEIRRTSLNAEARSCLEFFLYSETDSCNVEIDVTYVPESVLSIFLVLAAYVIHQKRSARGVKNAFGITLVVKGRKKDTLSAGIAYENKFICGIAIGSQFVPLPELKKTIFSQSFLNSLFNVIQVNKSARQAEEQATYASNTADAVANGRCLHKEKR